VLYMETPDHNPVVTAEDSDSRALRPSGYVLLLRGRRSGKGHSRHRRIIEIGSVYSSTVMPDTCESLLPGQRRLTFIDPFPANLTALSPERSPI